MRREIAEHKDFLEVSVLEHYKNLTAKSKHYFAAAYKAYPTALYYIKVDDDVFVPAGKLPAAVASWSSLHADYIGCIGGGDNAIEDANHKNYEPDAALFPGKKLTIRAAGPAYALSRRAVRSVIVHSFHQLRHLGNEDISMGVWMMGHRICFLFDARMFAGRCFTDAFAIWDGSRCAGVCDPAKEYPAYMNDTACTGPYAPGQSTPFHIGHCPKGHALPRRARARQLLRWSLG